MAARKTAPKSADPTTEEKVTNPTTEETAEEKTPLEKELEKLPQVDDVISAAMLEETAEFLVEFDAQHKIFMENSLDESAVTHAAESHDDEDLVKMREQRDETQKKIEELKAQVETLEGVVEKQEQSMYDRAEKILSETVSEKDRLRAKFEKERIADKVKDNFGMIKKRMPEWQDYADLQQWFRNTNLRIYGQATTATTSRSTADRRHAEKIRTWAKNNGITVSDRGRIPQHVIVQYEVLHGE